MTPERSPILIAHGVTRQPFEAVFVDGITTTEARKTDAIWTPFLEMLLVEAQQRGIPEDQWPEHRHWQWGWKMRHLPPDARHVGIEVGELMQGMMIVLPTGHVTRHSVSSGAPLVYIEFIAAAPWNYRDLLARLDRQPHFARIGQVLLTAAITLSRELGYEGRIGLHSLPQTEAFYSERCGMADLGIETFTGPGYQYDLRYYEMTAESADQFTGGKR